MVLSKSLLKGFILPSTLFILDWRKVYSHLGHCIDNSKRGFRFCNLEGYSRISFIRDRQESNKLSLSRANMSGPDATFRDSERIEMINRISSVILGAIGIHRNTTFRTVWACLWVSDTEKLREFDADIPDHVDGLAPHLECLEYYKTVEECQLK